MAELDQDVRRQLRQGAALEENLKVNLEARATPLFITDITEKSAKDEPSLYLMGRRKEALLIKTAVNISCQAVSCFK